MHQGSILEFKTRTTGEADRDGTSPKAEAL